MPLLEKLRKKKIILLKNGHSYWYRIAAIYKNKVESEISNRAGVNIKTEPLLIINGGEEYTNRREVMLTILAYDAQTMIISDNMTFSGEIWEDYTTSKSWIMESGAGKKTIYMKVKYDSTESNVVQALIFPQQFNNTDYVLSSAKSSLTLIFSLTYRFFSLILGVHKYT